jgi:O-antigen/teichoic acid export membrane protein
VSHGRRLAVNFLTLSGGEAGAKVIGFLTFAFLARALDPAAYGAVELAVSLFLFFSLVVDFGLGSVGAREVAQHRDQIPELAAGVPVLRFVVSLVAFLLMILAPAILRQPPETATLIRLIALALFGGVWIQRWLFQGLEKMLWVAMGQLIRGLLFLGGVVLLVREPSDLRAVGVAHVLAAGGLATYYIVAQHSLITPVRFRAPIQLLRYLARQSFPIGTSQAVWVFNHQLPTFLIAALLGGEELAWFGAAQRIFLSLLAFSWIYRFNLFPSLSKRWGESSASFLRLQTASLRVTAWSVMLVGVTGTILADPICRLAFGEDFGAAATPLAVIIWIIPTAVLSGHARSTLIIGERQKGVVIAHVVGVLVTLCLGPFSIRAWGATGAAIAMLVSAVAIWFTAHLLAARWVIPLPIMGILAKPVGCGLIAGAIGYKLGPNPWIAATLAIVSIMAAGLLLDRSLGRDLSRIVRSKKDRDASTDLLL